MRTIHGHAMPEPVLDGNGKPLTGTPMCAGHNGGTLHHRVTACGRCVDDAAFITNGSLSCGKCKIALGILPGQGVRW